MTAVHTCALPILVEACRAGGFRSVNIDLIYGLPKQNPEGFARPLDTVLEMRPDRLAVYGYAHLPQLFKAQRQLQSQDLPSSPATLALLRLAIEHLTAARYAYLGLDPFALPDDAPANAHAHAPTHHHPSRPTTPP